MIIEHCPKFPLKLRKSVFYSKKFQKGFQKSVQTGAVTKQQLQWKPSSKGNLYQKQGSEKRNQFPKVKFSLDEWTMNFGWLAALKIIFDSFCFLSLLMIFFDYFRWLPVESQLVEFCCIIFNIINSPSYLKIFIPDSFWERDTDNPPTRNCDYNSQTS